VWLGNLFYEQDRFPEAQASFTHFTAITPKPGAAWAFLVFATMKCATTRIPWSTSRDGWMEGAGKQRPARCGQLPLGTAADPARPLRESLYLLAGRATRKGESPLLVEAMGLASMRMTNLPEDYPPERREQVWLAGKAAFYASQHHFDRAREYFRRLLAEYGNLPNVHYFQGTLYKLHSRPDEAEREFRRELEVSPRHAAAMLELAQIDLDRDNSANAESLARQAVQLEPMNPDTHYILGRALLERWARERECARTGAGRTSWAEDAAIHFHLAAVYRGLGRKQDAERENSAYMSLRKRDGTLDQASGESEAHHSGKSINDRNRGIDPAGDHVVTGAAGLRSAFAQHA